MNILIHEIYNTLIKLGIVKSGNQFSIDMLGRSSRLYSFIKATGRNPPIDVALGLYGRLDKLCLQAENSGDKQMAKTLDELTSKLWVSMMDESLQKQPHRRRKHLDDARTVN